MTPTHPSAPRAYEARISTLDDAIFREAVEVAPVPLIVVRGDGIVMSANAAAVELFGYPASEVVGQSVEMLVPKGLRPKHRKYRKKFGENPTPRPMGFRRDLLAISRDGSEIPVEVGLSPVDTSGGTMVICAIVDLTSRKQNEDNLEDLADLLEERNERLLDLVATDGLTSLRSRRALLDHLATQIEGSLRHARPFSILLLDIDHFKQYNDNHGHLAGDEVLRQFGQILRATARRSDVVGRLGGEEFGIILPETDRAGAVTIGDRFRTAVEMAEWPRQSVTVSVGAVTFEIEEAVPRPAAPDISQILAEADRALYHSKEEGRNRVTHVADIP